MDWLKKKKDEAKQAASQAAAKIQNKRTSTFKGDGNVLGGGDSASSAPAPTRGFKVRFHSMVALRTQHRALNERMDRYRRLGRAKRSHHRSQKRKNGNGEKRRYADATRRMSS